MLFYSIEIIMNFQLIFKTDVTTLPIIRISNNCNTIPYNHHTFLICGTGDIRDSPQTIWF